MRGALAAFQKSVPRGPTSMASAVAKLHAKASKATALENTNTSTTTEPQVLVANQHMASSDAETAPPSEGSAVGARFSSTGGHNPSHIAVSSNAAANAGDIPNAAASAAASPGAAEVDTVTTTASSAPNRKPNALGSKGRFSTMSRVVKSFPRNGSGRGESMQADSPNRAADCAAAAAAANSSGGQQQTAGAGQPRELTPTQAAVLAADNKLERLLNVGGILRANNTGECPHGFPQGTPAWDSAEVVVGSGDRATSCGRSEGDRCDLGDGIRASGGGRGLGRGSGAIDADDDVGKIVIKWASRFCEPETGFPAADSEEGVRLGRALAPHVARDGDVGLVGTRWEMRMKPSASSSYCIPEH